MIWNFSTEINKSALACRKSELILFLDDLYPSQAAWESITIALGFNFSLSKIIFLIFPVSHGTLEFLFLIFWTGACLSKTPRNITLSKGPTWNHYLILEQFIQMTGKKILFERIRIKPFHVSNLSNPSHITCRHNGFNFPYAIN